MKKNTAFWLGVLAIFIGLLPASADVSGPSNVLVVYNQNNPDSVTLAQYYQTRRGIPGSHLLAISGPAGWASPFNTTALESDYDLYLYGPINAAIIALGSKGERIDYVVLCRNLPYLLTANDPSVGTLSLDAVLVSPSGQPNPQAVSNTGDLFLNDFHKSPDTFANYKANGGLNPNSQASVNIPDVPLRFLVTRLDGPSLAVAESLVDNAQAPRVVTARVLQDGTTTTIAPTNPALPFSVISYQSNIASAALALTQADILNDVVANLFVDPTYRISGYFSYGILDTHFNNNAFLQLRFAPGSIGAMASPTSGFSIRTFSNQSGQMITPLSRNLTGAIVDINHPDGVDASNNPLYLYAVDEFADPAVFLPDYFVSNWNLVDSLYASLPYIGWTEMVIGDPLCVYVLPPVPSLAHLHSGAAIGFSTWGTTNSKPTGNNVKSSGSVGDTSSWVNGGAGSSGTKASW